MIVGTGSIGERHVRCFLRTGRADVSLCEINPRVREDVAKRYEITAAFADLDPAVESAPDAAVVCTPAHLHVAIATKLAERGAHLLIEKPLSTSLAGIDQLDAAVRTRGLVAGVAYVYRSHPLLARMREAVHGGRFGRAIELVVVSGQHFPYYRPAYRDTYYAHRETGGGAIQDALTHMVNAGQWLVGPVTELVADAAHLRLDGVDVEDTVHLIARHGPVMASYSLNQHQAPNETTITVVCESGTARFELHRQQWLSQTRPDGDWKVEETCTLERDDLFVAQAHGFLDAVAGIRPVACTLEEAVQTLRVNLAAIESATTRSWQTLEVRPP